MNRPPHKYTTNIPEAREELLRIASEIEAQGLSEHAQQIRGIVENKMIRRQGPRRAPATRRRVTESIRRKVIRDLKRTDLPQEEIARKYNIDGGRVSEIGRSLRN